MQNCHGKFGSLKKFIIFKGTNYTPMFQEIQEIQKEQVPLCTYEKISAIPQESNLLLKLRNAMILGNTHRSKVSIVFCDDEGPKKVTTTVWAVGDTFITLKGGVWIPISKIVDIIF
jgi:hypothetical protein